MKRLAKGHRNREETCPNHIHENVKTNQLVSSIKQMAVDNTITYMYKPPKQGEHDKDA